MGGGGYGLQNSTPIIRPMPGPSFQAPHVATSSRLPSLLGGGANGDDMRGKLTGDCCLTIALDFDGYQVATWDEKAAECTFQDLHQTKTSSTATLDVILRDVISSSKAASSGEASIPTTETKKIKKSKNAVPSLALGEGGITVVVGNDSTQKALREIVLASAASGFKIKNIFRRGIATITGLLSRQVLQKELNNDKDKGAKSDIAASNPIDSSITVFFISSRKMSNGTVELDASLVVCEGADRAKNKLGYERLSTLAVASKTLTSSPSAAMDNLHSLFDGLLTSASIDATCVDAIVCDGNDLQLPVTKLVLGGNDRKVPILSAGEHDAVRGGCLLSAAELESSKNYLQHNDKWVLAFLLPVADGFMSRQVGIQTTNAAGEKQVECVFTSGRLWKADIGPLKPGALKKQSSSISKTFVNVLDKRRGGLLSLSWLGGKTKAVTGNNASDTHIVTSDFCLTLVERTSSDTNWVPIGGKDIRPLHKEGVEVVGSTLHLHVDPATGLVTYTDTKGKTLEEVNNDFWWWVQFFLAVLGVVALLSSFFLFGHYQEWSLTRQHTAWLIGFYKKHAPDKLNDKEYVARTIKVGNYPFSNLSSSSLSINLFIHFFSALFVFLCSHIACRNTTERCSYYGGDFSEPTQRTIPRLHRSSKMVICNVILTVLRSMITVTFDVKICLF